MTEIRAWRQGFLIVERSRVQNRHAPSLPPCFSTQRGAANGIIPVPRVKGRVYKAVIRLKGITSYSQTFKTRNAAEHWAKQQEADADLVRAGVGIKVLRMNLAELCDNYEPGGRRFESSRMARGRLKADNQGAQGATTDAEGAPQG